MLILKKLVCLLLMFLQVLFPATCIDTGEDLEGIIIAPDGTEYVHLANEGFVTTFGSHVLFFKIEGEDPYLGHLDSMTETGLYSCEGDPDLSILMRIIPNNEWRAYYRKASLPKLDLSPDNCVRLELVGYREIFSSDWINPSIEHMSCGAGITEKNDIKAFLADVRSQKSPEEAGLYDLVRKPDGFFENCYMYGKVYGYFKDEPNLAVPFTVWSYDDKAYSIDLGDRAYVLPVKWLPMLTATE